EELAPPVEPVADDDATAGDAPEVHPVQAVANWTFAPPAPVPSDANGLPAGAPQNMDPGYLTDLWQAIWAQDINGNDALAALAQQPPAAAPTP
ncbi:MAG: transglycosylase family protein, partial [Mycobacterium sp.]